LDERLKSLTAATDLRLEAVRGTVEQRLKTLQDENSLKLEQIAIRWTSSFRRRSNSGSASRSS